MSTTVTPQYLLEGAVYAFEQCGLLLRDADLLHQKESYASAVALTAFAWEALGQWTKLLDLRKKVLDGENLTIKELQKHCWNHLSKQEAGMLSLVVRAELNSEYGRLLTARMNSKPGSEQWKALTAEIEKLDEQMKQNVPIERHKQRLVALYVDPVSPDQWSRPRKEISRTFASDFLREANNDYWLQYERYTKLENLDPELISSLRQWDDRPKLPDPITRPI
jgi:AbiV family abortive infection protein